MDQRLERILPRVQKPARYTGGEYRQIIKDKAEVDLRLAAAGDALQKHGLRPSAARQLQNVLEGGLLLAVQRGGRNDLSRSWLRHAQRFFL